MKGWAKTFLLIMIVGVLGCQAPVGDLIIDSFEGDINKQTVDFGAAQGSALSVFGDKSQKVCGEQSFKLEYELKPSGYMWAARGYGLDVDGAAQWLVKPEEISWKRYNAIMVSMLGSNSGGVVAFDVKDNGGEVWRCLLDDDFIGWKEITCPFSGFFVRKDWQPEKAEKNDILDFPLKSFQFEPRLPGKGVFYFDCVKVVKAAKKNN